MTDMSTMQSALQELLDKQAIHETTLRYCRGADRLDADLITSVFHPDARDDHGGHVLKGADTGPAIVKMLSDGAHETENSLFLGSRSTLHYISSQTIEVYGDTAAAESYFTTVHFGTRNGVSLKMQTYGRWVDRFERRNGEWKVIDRTGVYELVDENPLAHGPWVEMGSKSDASRDRSDPSYAVFRGPQSAS